MGGGGDGGGQKPPPPPRVHPRYIPKRGAVLKGVVRGMLRLFVFLPPSRPVSAIDGRVRPAPPSLGGDGVGEQGK